jgi:hypothetical protein
MSELLPPTDGDNNSNKVPPFTAEQVAFLVRQMGSLASQFAFREREVEPAVWELQHQDILSHNQDINRDPQRFKTEYNPDNRFLPPVELRITGKPYTFPPPDVLKFQRSVDVSHSSIASTPPGFYSGGFIAKKCKGLRSMGGGIEVRGPLILDGCTNLESLPSASSLLRGLGDVCINDCSQLSDLSPLCAGRESSEIPQLHNTDLIVADNNDHSRQARPRPLTVSALEILNVPVTEIPMALIPEYIVVVSEQPGIAELMLHCMERRRASEGSVKSWNGPRQSWDHFRIIIISKEADEKRRDRHDPKYLDGSIDVFDELMRRGITLEQMRQRLLNSGDSALTNNSNSPRLS